MAGIKGAFDKFSIMKKFGIEKMNYGVMTTRSKIIGSKIFRRIIAVNPEFDLNNVRDLLNDYIRQLRKAKINVPRVIHSEIKNNRIVFDSEYKGKNLINRLDNPSLIEVIDSINKAKKANIFIDPHITNFVLAKDKKVYYVDFCPPYTTQYLRMRMQIADKSQKSIVKKSFDYFAQREIGYHFIADMMKIKRYKDDIKNIYFMLKKRGLVSYDYNKSLKKACSIRKFEEGRLKKRLFL